ncbi:MAG: hypothetical protein L0G87_16290, partial [Renibacterium salmoninarum]|nr:hypothetical protein [Renibacterium salmoninarum]
RESMLAVARRSPLPGLVIAASDGRASTALGSPVPLLQGRRADAGALAFVCREMVCQRPTADLRQLEAQLSGYRPRT